MPAFVGRDLILVTLAGLVLRLIFLPDPGHIVDLTAFGGWALGAADNPWNRAYEVTNANYPPGALLFFELIGRVYRAVIHDDPDGRSLRIALKLPSVAFDLIGGAVIYGIAQRFTDHRRSIFAAALFDLNPAIVYDSSLWGQNDSITTVSALAAVWCLLCRRRVTAWIVLAFAVLNKPPVLVLAPLFVLEAWNITAAGRRRRLLQTAWGVAGAIVLGYLTAAPLYTERSFFAVYSRMIAWYGVGSSLYPYTSANAFNLYALWGDFFAPDTARLGFLPIKYWADIAFIAVALLIYRRYLKLCDDRGLLEASFTALLALFLILTEMHERYLLYALTFAPPLAVIDRRYLWSTAALTLTQWLNLEYSLSYMWINSDKPPGINPHEFAPVLARLSALTNCAVWVTAMRIYLRRESAPVAVVTGAAAPAQ